MLKECLNEVVNSKLDLGDKRKKSIKRYLDYYDEDQLYNVLQTPLGIIAEDINIYYIPNVGFRCSNDIRQGRLPICNIFTRILNEKYKSLNITQ